MRELVTAVRRADADEVRALLESGADPDTLDDGLPVLCLAVAAYDEPVAKRCWRPAQTPCADCPTGAPRCCGRWTAGHTT